MKECKTCGKELIDRQTSYCSYSCSVTWWHKHRAASRHHEKVCEECEKDYIAVYPNRKYCSDKCKDRAGWRTRTNNRPIKSRTQQTIWKNRRPEIAKRYDSRCWLCKKELPDRFNVHHLQGGDDRDSLSELVVPTCPGCHQRLHGVSLCTDGKDWWISSEIFDMLKERFNEKYIEVR